MTLAQLDILAAASITRARPPAEEGGFLDLMAFGQGVLNGG
jgi:hypothetical protein